jgi:hypothetical protein
MLNAVPVVLDYEYLRELEVKIENVSAGVREPCRTVIFLKSEKSISFVRPFMVCTARY